MVDMLPMLIGGDSPALSPKQIAARLGRNANAVRNLIKNLRQQKKIRIGGWLRTKGKHTALWKWGKGKDAKPLGNQTNAEACRRWYRDNSGAEHQRSLRKDKKALKAYSQHGVKAIDPLLAAIMGEK